MKEGCYGKLILKILNTKKYINKLIIKDKKESGAYRKLKKNNNPIKCYIDNYP